MGDKTFPLPRFTALDLVFLLIMNSISNICCKHLFWGRQTLALLRKSTPANSNTLFSKYASTYDGNSNDILTNMENRNPRNMELLRLARKPKGYDLDSFSPSYWYRVEFVTQGGRKGHRYMVGLIRHSSGKVVLQASSDEWAIRSR